MPPAQDPFYTPPSAAAGRPGSLIRSRPFTAYVSGLAVNPGKIVEEPARAWQIMYASKASDGHPITVTASVLVPTRPWTNGPRPVIAYAPGTVGAGRQCAPSYGLANGTWYESALPTLALARGYAVIVPDNEGMGVPGPPTYLAGPSEGHVLLDAVRAGLGLNVGLTAASPVAIWGYSQGGGAAVWGGELQPSYAPDVNLKAVAAGGVPADLEAAAVLLTAKADKHLVLLAYRGLHFADPKLPWNALLTPVGAHSADVLGTKCEVDPSVAGALGGDTGTSVTQGLTLADIFTADPLSLPEWRATLRRFSAGQRAPRVPTYLYGSPGDEVVEPVQQRALLDAYCRLGASAQFVATPSVPHVVAAIAWAPIALGWISDRLDGQRASSSCTGPVILPVVKVTAPAVDALATTGPRFDISWEGAPNAITYTVQVRQTSSLGVAAGARGWQTPPGYEGTARTSLRFAGRRGQSYEFRVRATNPVGGDGPWATARTVTLSGIRIPGARFRGPWRARAAQNAYDHRAIACGAPRSCSLTLDYDGGALKLVGSRTPQGGRARLTLDGRSRTVSFRSSQVRRRVVLFTSGVRRGRHRLTLRAISGTLNVEGVAIDRRAR